GARAKRLLRRRGSLLRSRGLAAFVTPRGIYIFAVVAIAQSIPRHVVPKKSSGGIIDIRLVVLQRRFVGHRSLKIVGPFLAAVDDLPRLLVVIAGDCRGRPKMAVAGNFSAVVKIIEHAELQRQLVF